MADRPHRGGHGGHRGARGGGARGGGGGGGGRGGGAAAQGQGQQAQGQDRERPKKENILDLKKYMDKRITVKFNGGREATGVLKGYDALMNLVLDEVEELLRDDEGNEVTRPLGLVVVRGTLLVVISPVDGSEAIANPFLQAEDDRSVWVGVFDDEGKKRAGGGGRRGGHTIRFRICLGPAMKHWFRDAKPGKVAPGMIRMRVQEMS
ncbi:hypothetical protein VTH06DRAFT_8361 [Thermothelomyces fergusii]